MAQTNDSRTLQLRDRCSEHFDIEVRSDDFRVLKFMIQLRLGLSLLPVSLISLLQRKNITTKFSYNAKGKTMKNL